MASRGAAGGFGAAGRGPPGAVEKRSRRAWFGEVGGAVLLLHRGFSGVARRC